MDIVKQILESSNCDYDFIFHEKQIITAADGAAFLGIEVGQTAPTLIIKAENDYFSIVFSGSRDRIDFEKLATILNAKRVKLAKKEKVRELIGFEPGNIPMIGLNLPTVIDKKLMQYPFVYGGSGLPNRTLKLSPTALIKLNNVITFLEV